MTDDAHAAAETAYDDDNPRWTKEDFARARPASGLPPEVLANFPKTAARLGRPKAEVTKVPVKIRLDPDVLNAWRGSGAGWQTRMNDALRKTAPVVSIHETQAEAMLAARRGAVVQPDVSLSAMQPRAQRRPSTPRKHT